MTVMDSAVMSGMHSLAPLVAGRGEHVALSSGILAAVSIPESLSTSQAACEDRGTPQEQDGMRRDEPCQCETAMQGRVTVPGARIFQIDHEGQGSFMKAHRRVQDLERAR